MSERIPQFIPAQAYVDQFPSEPWSNMNAIYWAWRHRAVNGVTATKVLVKKGRGLFVVVARVPAFMDWEEAA